MSRETESAWRVMRESPRDLTIDTVKDSALTPEQIKNAVRTVAVHSENATECAELLSMLGLEAT